MTPKGLSFVLAAALPLAIASPIAKPYGPYKYSTTLPIVGGLPALPVPATPPALPPILPTVTIGGADGVTLPAPGLPSLPVSVPSPNGLLTYGGLRPVPTITVGGSDGSFTSLPVVKPLPSLTSTTTIIVTVYPTLPAATIPDIPVPLTTITSLVTITLPRPPISVGGADGVTFPAPPLPTPPTVKPPPPATYGSLPPPPPPPSLPQLPPNVVGGGGILGGLLGNTGGHITPPGTTVPKIGGGGFIGTPNPPSPPNGGAYGGHSSGGGNSGGNSEICDDPFFAEASPLLKQLCSGSGSTTSGSSATSNPPPLISSSPAGYNPQYKRDIDSSSIAKEDPESKGPPRTPQGLLLQKIMEKCVSELGDTKGLALCPRALNFIPQSSLPGDGKLSDEIIDALIQRGLTMAEEGDNVPASKRGLGAPGQLLSGVSLDEGLGGGDLSPEQIEGILAAAIGKAGLPLNGLPLNGLPLNGLPLNGLPLNGLPLKERGVLTTPEPNTILAACEKAFTQAQAQSTTPKLDSTQICKAILSYIPKTTLPTSGSISPEDLKKIIESVLSSHGLAKRQHYQFGSGGPSESSGNAGLPSTPSTPSNPQYGNGGGSTSGNGGSSLPPPPPIAPPKPPVQPPSNPPYVPTSSDPSPPATALPNGGDLQSSIASSIAAGLAHALGPNGSFNPGTFFGDGNKGGSGTGSNSNGNGKGGYY
ncbi:hypothetical protein HYALB_00006749 [Hymenoscyphus albidus]|uniref:Uncharacterized protein n=1 Tax=Hymenoscyphus albidus TaxID=595503 RepID=A0A9N9M460_9HELO|nr:hypothetical protein HYALB_00006749 [Hymenoscyphus albidus]